MLKLAVFTVAFVLLSASLPSAGTKKLKLMELESKLNFGTNVGGSAHPCFRACDGVAMSCQYNLTLSLYSTFSMHCGDCPRTRAHCSRPGCITAGGTSRPVYVANLMLPGPGIHVCEGDKVTVRVENAYPNEGATLHWHGQWMRSNPHMDGVPYVTQCPIQPNNVFEYAFEAYPAGTHIWHAHIGLLETDGLFGSFVVRRPRDKEHHADLYDEDLAEHTLALWHWYPHLSEDYLPLRLFRNESVEGMGFIINGKGIIGKEEAPMEEISVTQGKRYRLRLLHNSAVYCPLQVSIDNHTLTAIASDGANFEPVEVDSLMLNAGERWDVVVQADQPIDKYWVRFRALGDCGAAKSSVFQQAVLVYEGSNADAPAAPRPHYDSCQRGGKLLNPMQVVATDYSKNQVLHVSDLKNVETSIHGDIKQTPDRTLYLELDFEEYDELSAPGPYPQNNRITFEYPAVPLILQRYEKGAAKSGRCSTADAREHCIGKYCSCTLVERVPLNALVEIVLVDLSIDRAMDHPYHIHGTNFHVVAEGTVGVNVSMSVIRDRNERGLIAKTLSAAAPLKDTVTVPSQGYVIIRFRAINPGFWFFHCHVSNHVHLGMGLVLQVGDESEMPPVPHNFPRCGNWAFSENDDGEHGDTGSGAGRPASLALMLLITLYASLR